MVWKYFEMHRPQQLENARNALRLDASLPLEEVTAAALEHARRGREQVQAGPKL